MRTLGPFVCIEELAKGGMGEVWLAKRFGLGTAPDLVVVKTVRADKETDVDARRRFKDESRIGLLLAHPCIARVVDAGRVRGQDYLALEVVDGINLVVLVDRLQKQGEKLPEPIALFIAGCMLDGLAFAHEARHPLDGHALGVVHRDISPHNVMVDASGNAKLIDFGVALSSLKQTQTEQGIVVGKMAYMSPEQARGDDVDARADIFAVAVVLYELLTGARYYGARKHDEIWRVAGTGQFVPAGLNLLAGDVRSVIVRALAPDADRRTPRAALMRAEVASLLLVRGGAAKASEQLAALVNDYGAAEVERIRRARAVALTVAAPAAEDPTTESLGKEELLAVEAALRARHNEPPTVTLQLSSVDIPLLDVDATPRDPRPAYGAQVDAHTPPSMPLSGLRAQTQSFADDTPRDPRAPYDPGQRADTVRVVAPVTMPRDAPSRGRTDPGERSTARQRPARRTSPRVWIGVAAAALAALVVAVALAVPAPPAATADAGPEDAGPARVDAGVAQRAPSVDAGPRAATDAGVSVVDAVTDAGAAAPPAGTVETDPLCRMITAVKTCSARCAREYSNASCALAKRFSRTTRTSVTNTIKKCLATCGIDPP